MVTHSSRRTLPGLLLLGTLASTLSPAVATGQFLELVTVEALTPDSVTAERGARVAISADGRYVAFCSKALPGDLVPGKVVPLGATDTSNVFVRDIVSGTTAILTLSATDPSVTSNGTCAPDVQITPDGRYVAFKSTATNLLDSTWSYAPGSPSGWVYDRQSGALSLVDEAVEPLRAAGVREMVMSENGRFVAFSSAGSGPLRQLVPNFVDDNGPLLVDLYVRDLHTRDTRLISRQHIDSRRGSPDGVETTTGESPRVFSADGTALLFAAEFSQLIQNGTTARNLYVYRWTSDTIALVSARSGESTVLAGAAVDVDDNPREVSFSITADGAFAAFTASTTLAELTADGTAGRRNVYVRDLQAAAAPTTLVSRTPSSLGGNGDSTNPIIGRAGTVVVFESLATDLIANFTDTASFTDVFATPMAGSNRAGPIEWLTRDAVLLAGGNQDAALEDVTADGRYVAWRSAATNFVHGSVLSDANNADDVFVQDRVAGGPVSVMTVVPVGAPATANGASGWSTLLPTGQVAFFSDATNLLVTPPTSGTNIFAPVSGAADVSITGTVRDGGGVGLPGITVTLTGSAFDATTTAADGRYTFGGLTLGGSFVATPSATGYVFTPASVSFPNVTGDESADFTATCAPAISGLVRDRLDGALAGVTVTLSGAGTASAVTDEEGRYTFTGVTLGQSFTVTPGRAGFTFEPASLPITTTTCGTIPATFVATSGQFTRYFAEGATSAFFDTRIALLNASGVPANVRLTFQQATGSDVVHELPLDGVQRATVDPKTIPGLETAEFSTVVSSDQPVIADRTMRWDASGYGSHAETSLVAPRTSWYLAEGATTGEFQLFYLLQNPNDIVADVEVTYLLPAPAQPFTKTYAIQPHTRRNIWVNLEDARLAHAEVSAMFTSPVPVIVERAMYRNTPTQIFAAGHEAAAVAGPAMQWFFAEGATGPYFDLFYLIANPGTTPAVIDGRYLLPDGRVLSKRYTVAPQSRFNVWADLETFPGQVGLPLADTAVSATFTSANDVGFVAERAMWWPGNASQWLEGHASAGALQSGTKWAVADGEAGGPLGTETYLLIANTSNRDGTVQVTLVYEDGGTSVLTRPVKANARANVALPADVPAASNRRFGAVVESLGPDPVQIVVERAMYDNARGVTWAAGSNNLATRLR